jgi:hypothetical protein
MHRVESRGRTPGYLVRRRPQLAPRARGRAKASGATHSLSLGTCLPAKARRSLCLFLGAFTWELEKPGGRARRQVPGHLLGREACDQYLLRA